MKPHKYQYVVICDDCGIQPLSRESYEVQMFRPNSTWRCPSCGQEASWDDECLETNPVTGPEESEE